MILFPQLITCGLLMPRDEMPQLLEWISRVLPLTYGIEALQGIAAGGDLSDVGGSVLVIVGFILGAVVLGSATLRRRTP